MNSEREKNLRRVCESLFLECSPNTLTISPITGVICKLYLPASATPPPSASASSSVPPSPSVTSSSPVPLTPLISSSSPASADTTSSSTSSSSASSSSTGKWITGRVLFGQSKNNFGYVYFEQYSCRWIDFSAKSTDIILFTTDQVIHLPQYNLARKFRGSIQGLTKMECFNDGKELPSLD